MQKAQRRVSRRVSALFAVASLVALLLVAAPAGAATSAQQGYSQPGSAVEQRVESQGDPRATTRVEAVTQTDSKLPFTGLDVIAILAVGSALMVVGLGVRKLSATTAS